MKQFLLALSFLLSTYSYSQSCGCDHTISGLSTTSVNIINATTFTYSAGDVFCISAGNYAGLRLIGFKGAPSNPLKFINCGGEVTFSESTYPGVDFRNCEFIHFTGTGDSTRLYGLRVIGSPTSGVNVGSFSSDVELDHLEIVNVGFAGIMAKTDPNCSDTNTWRVNGYVLRNLNIHHNYIHNTDGEGVYIGSTGGYKVTTRNTCGGTKVFAHWLENVSVHHNSFENIGWDGIQLNLVRANGEIYDNTVIGYGVNYQLYQNFAMSLGGGVYNVYNNYLQNDSVGNGIQLISAQSGTKLFNNVLINPKEHGIFIHNRHKFDNPNEGYFIMNNTLVNPELSGIKLAANIVHSDSGLVGVIQNNVPSYFINNVILNPGNRYENGSTWKGVQENYLDFNEVATRDSMQPNVITNLFTRQASSVGFADTANNDYRPLSISSSLVNMGTDVSGYGVSFDLNNLTRPQGIAYDIGAYEWNETVTSIRTLNPEGVDFYKVHNSQLVQIIGLQKGENMLRLYNTLGQHVFQISLNNEGDFTIELPILKSGVYIAALVTPSGVTSKKIVLQ